MTDRYTLEVDIDYPNRFKVVDTKTNSIVVKDVTFNAAFSIVKIYNTSYNRMLKEAEEFNSCLFIKGRPTLEPRSLQWYKVTGFLKTILSLTKITDL